MEPTAPKSSSAFLRRIKADLRRDKKKLKVLGGLVSLLGVAAVPLLLTGVPSKRYAVSTLTPQSLIEDVPAFEVDTELRAQLGEIMRGFESNSPQRWKPSKQGSPFAKFDAGSAGLVKDAALELRIEEERVLAEGLRPSATILSSTQGGVAIIGGKSYRAGEDVESFVLVNVDSRCIVLRGRHAEYPLTVPVGNGEPR